MGLSKKKYTGIGWKVKIRIRNSKCQFCNKEESVEHLFFHCSIARFVFGTLSIVFLTAGLLKAYKIRITKKHPGPFCDLCFFVIVAENKLLTK